MTRVHRQHAKARVALTSAALTRDDEGGECDDTSAAAEVHGAAAAAVVSRRKLALTAAAAALGTNVLGLLPGQNNNNANALVDSANAQFVFEGASRSVVGLADYVDGGANGGYSPRGTGVVWSELGYVVTNFHVVSSYLPGSPATVGKSNNKNSGGAPKELRVNVPDVKTGDAVWYAAEAGLYTLSHSLTAPGFNS